MASLAHKFAYESDLMTASAVSAVHLPYLARGYRILSMPHTVINGQHHLRGRVRDIQLLEAIMRETQA